MGQRAKKENERTIITSSFTANTIFFKHRKKRMQTNSKSDILKKNVLKKTGDFKKKTWFFDHNT